MGGSPLGRRGLSRAGRSSAQRLVGAGEIVFDVPAKLAARVRVYSQGHGRKTDLDDAVSVGTAALLGDGIARVHCDDALVSLRLLSDRRAELVALRTQAVCRLHRLLVELTPGGLARKLGADKALRTLALLRPDTPVDIVRVQLAHEHVVDIQAIDAKIKQWAARSASSSRPAEHTSPISTESVQSSPAGSWPRSRTSTASRAGTTSPPTTAPHPSMPPPASRSDTVSPEPGIAASTTRYT